MRSSGHLLRRAGREFVRNLIWMGVVPGLLAAVLAAATDLSLVGTMAFVGVCVAVVAAVVTVVVIWSEAYDETTRLGGHNYPGSPPDRGDGPGGGWESVDAGGLRQPSERSDALRRQMRARALATIARSHRSGLGGVARRLVGFAHRHEHPSDSRRRP